MTFEDAVVKSVQQYYAGKDPVALMKASGKESRYTREYFDELEEEMCGPKKKTKKSKKEDAEVSSNEYS